MLVRKILQEIGVKFGIDYHNQDQTFTVNNNGYKLYLHYDNYICYCIITNDSNYNFQLSTESDHMLYDNPIIHKLYDDYLAVVRKNKIDNFLGDITS